MPKKCQMDSKSMFPVPCTCPTKAKRIPASVIAARAGLRPHDPRDDKPENPAHHVKLDLTDKARGAIGRALVYLEACAMEQRHDKHPDDAGLLAGELRRLLACAREAR